MQIGTKLTKPVSGKTYADAAVWCNANYARLSEQDTYYEIIALPDVAPTVADYENAVQNYLDQVAQSQGYDNAYTCLSYLNSTNTVWQAEAAKFNIWRDQVWQYCHLVLDELKANLRAAPSIAALQAELPKSPFDD